MPRLITLSLLAFLSVFALWPADEARATFGNSIQGSWEIKVIPQPTPDFPVPPPPFISIFAFHFGGTLSETDTQVHPGARFENFLDFGPLSGSDGLGVWKRKGFRAFGLTFVKMLFVEGEHVGVIRVRGELALGKDRSSVDGRADSDIIVGSDLETGEVVFTGPVLFDGRRLKVQAL